MLRTVLRIAGFLILVALFIFCARLVYLRWVLPDVGKPPDIRVEITPARVARGEYLVQHVARCVDCHSERNYDLLAGPIVPGTMGQGGEIWDEKKGVPGRIIARNITPYHLGSWTDGEIFRAITSGVSRDGSSLYPVMPYQNYGQMDSLDILSIIAYLRTLAPLKKDVEASKADFPENWKINTYPQKPHFHPVPARMDSIQYGSYLVTMANCMGCHNGDFSGNVFFPLPKGGAVYSANLTPDRVDGIGTWTREDFIQHFKLYAEPDFQPLPIAPDTYNTVMPWTMFAGMTEDDLGAIYAYLRTVQPVHHSVVKFKK